MSAKKLLAMLLGGLAIAFLNLWAIERDAKVFKINSMTERGVWR